MTTFPSPLLSFSKRLPQQRKKMGVLTTTAAAVLLVATLAHHATALPRVIGQELTTRASSGCGKTIWPSDFTHYRFGLKSSGKDRSYSYHVPANYDKNKAYPVVVGFHGSSSVGLFFELDTKMSMATYSKDVSEEGAVCLFLFPTCACMPLGIFKRSNLETLELWNLHGSREGGGLQGSCIIT